MKFESIKDIIAAPEYPGVVKEIESSKIVERFDAERMPLLAGALMNARPVCIHVEEMAKVSDRVSEYLLVKQKEHDTGYSDYRVYATHATYNEADNALKKAVESDLQKPVHERHNYVVVGKFEDIPLMLHANGQALRGSGVTMKFAYQCEDIIKNSMDYAVATIRKPGDRVPVYEQRWATLDAGGKLQLQEHKPELDKVKDDSKDPGKSLEQNSSLGQNLQHGPKNKDQGMSM